MSDTRTIVGHGGHGTQGPHIQVPSGFVPLRLHLEPAGPRVEISCPIAILGRHTDADLRIAHPEISRRHCRFAFADDKWTIRDLKSLNGIVLNNKSITEATLYAGDRLRLGCVDILVESATAVTLSPIADKNDKFRQIISMLPSDQRRAG